MSGAFEKSVQVGASRYVHIRSAFDPDKTRCGLTNTLQTFFLPTEEAPTCKHCQVPVRRPLARRSA